ncbi:hypothetical protein M5D96_000367 [Drosophila gunungcola]|uniref:Uncharacterized protein n=1 Tax=Drosophila gunungcola TaxID=103775 RepID=A0A9P9YW65_9MUSC|nr:hypothetical protein M5D96_000367 [Drosophila gunungcola]
MLPSLFALLGHIYNHIRSCKLTFCVNDWSVLVGGFPNPISNIPSSVNARVS